MAANTGSAAHLTVICVEIIEESGTPLDPREVILVGDADTRDQLSNACLNARQQFCEGKWLDEVIIAAGAEPRTRSSISPRALMIKAGVTIPPDNCESIDGREHAIDCHDGIV